MCLHCRQHTATLGRLCPGVAKLALTSEGFSTVSIDMICAEAAVTKRHFYEAFPNCEALLTAAYESVTREYFQAILVVRRGGAGAGGARVQLRYPPQVLNCSSTWSA